MVPQFQRHYKWKQAQWLELYEDILDQYEAPDVQAGNPIPNEGHFIGSIVLHPAPGPASTVARYWVIDGQQRLTTLLALLAALRDVRHELEPEWNPDTYTSQYLSNPYNPDQPHRLVPGDNDRSDFVSTVYEGGPTGQIGDAYSWYKKQIKKAASAPDFDFKKFENAVLLRLIVVEINTSDDDNINQIFNTINHSGMRLSAIDLIRNHSFMQFDNAVAADVYSQTWKPLEDALGSEGVLSQYFWAQLVRRNPKTTQRDLYTPFQKNLKELQRLSSEGPAVVARLELERLKREAPLFLAILRPGEHSLPAWNAELREAVFDLNSWGSSTHLPITLETLSRLEAGSTSTSDATRALQYILSFLVRRGLCAIPTNNLNRIISAIPSSLKPGAVAEQLAHELLRGNKYWPADNEVTDRGLTSPLYHTLQAGQVRFVLSELNDYLMPAETIVRDELTVEHIMPQVMTDAWKTMLTSNGVALETAEAKLHVIGNLTVTGQNSILGQRPPVEKSELLRKSNLPINRSAGIGDDWTPEMIDTRSAELLALAVKIWPRPSLATPEKDAFFATLLPEGFTVANVLDAIPPDTWIALDDLAQLSGETGDALVRQVEQAGYRVLPGRQLHSEVEGVPGLSDLDGFDFNQAVRISIVDAVASLEKVGADVTGRL